MFHGLWNLFNTANTELDDIISSGARSAMTDLQFLSTETQNWLESPRRKLQLRGNAYYHYDFKPPRIQVRTDIDGMPIFKPETDEFVIDNVYANMVDQKVNYILGKPFAMTTPNDAYAGILQQIFDKAFLRTLTRTAIDAVNEGMAWLFPYYAQDGSLRFQEYPAHEILPFWADAEHTRLDCAIRYYEVVTYEGKQRLNVGHVELYTVEGIQRFIFRNGALIPDVEGPGPQVAYATVTDSHGHSEPIQWERIPLIAFKCNAHEIPLIKRVQTLQDALNQTRSNWTGTMNKDINTSILAVYGYEGEDVADLRRKILQYGAVLLANDGRVEVLNVQHGGGEYTEYITQLHKALIENARGFDAKDDRMAKNPNEMNLRSMYSDIDLDADMMETQFQAALDQLLWFVDRHLINTGQGNFTNEDVTFTFNRNMIVNDSDAIANVSKSEGLVSKETLLAHHPYVTDVKAEMERLDKEQQDERKRLEDDDYSL